MSNMQRRKGAAGEREVAALLRDWLGMDIHRNWQGQSAEGGSDLCGVPGWAIEIKFANTYRSDWWRQTKRQANREGSRPALIYRLTGKGAGLHALDKWHVIVRLSDLTEGRIPREHAAEITLRAWIEFVRELIPCENPPQPMPADSTGITLAQATAQEPKPLRGAHGASEHHPSRETIA
jgi:hypothetical protein